MAHPRILSNPLKLLVVGLVLVCSFCIVGLHRSASGDLHAFPFSTPDCNRVLVYRFDSWDGFGSEFNIYLRAAALSSYCTLTTPSSPTHEPYGDLREFFLTPDLGCTLPAGTLDRWGPRLAVLPAGIALAPAAPPRAARPHRARRGC